MPPPFVGRAEARPLPMAAGHGADRTPAHLMLQAAGPGWLGYSLPLLRQHRPSQVEILPIRTTAQLPLQNISFATCKGVSGVKLVV